MSLVKVNGLELLVEVDSAVRADASVMATGRSVSGRLYATTTHRKVQGGFRVGGLTREAATSIEGWVIGRGSRFSFSKRRRIEDGTSADVFTRASTDGGCAFSAGASGTSAVFGPHALRLTASSQGFVQKTIPQGGDWSVSFFQVSAASNMISHNIIQRVGGNIEAFHNGASSATIHSFSFSEVDYGDVTRLNVTLFARSAVVAADIQTDFDEVWIRPYALTGQMRVLSGSTATPLCSPPFAFVQGDLLRNTGRRIEAKVVVADDAVQGEVDESFVYDARDLTFSFSER
jgi:hypothetical protein